MLTKAIEKRKTRRTHTRNFTASEVPASEHYLERTGIRGKKRWLLLVAIVILAVIILGNFILTCIFFAVLRITVDGTESFRFDDNGNIIFLKTATINELRLARRLTSLDNHLTLSSSDQNILMQSRGTPRNDPMTGAAYDPNQLIVESSEVLLNAFTSLSVQNSQGEALYADKRRVQFDIPTALNTLRGTKVVTNKVSSASNLTMSADNVALKGMGGVSLEGHSVNFTATSGITLQSDQSITIAGSTLTFPQLPMANISSSQQLPFKLCACRTAGNTFKLFLTPSSCFAANNTHPCL